MKPLKVRAQSFCMNGMIQLQMIWDEDCTTLASSDPRMMKQLPTNPKDGEMKTIILPYDPEKPVGSLTFFERHEPGHSQKILLPLFVYAQRDDRKKLVIVPRPDIPPKHIQEKWRRFDYVGGCFQVHSESGLVFVNEHAPVSANAIRSSVPRIKNLSHLLSFVVGDITEVELKAEGSPYKESASTKLIIDRDDLDAEPEDGYKEKYEALKGKYKAVRTLLRHLLAACAQLKLSTFTSQRAKEKWKEVRTESEDWLSRNPVAKTFTTSNVRNIEEGQRKEATKFSA